MQQVRTTRLEGLDAVKGLAIVGVVLIHAAPVPWRDHPSYSAHVVGGLARTAVPCFLAITGLLVAWKASSRDRLLRNLLTFTRLHIVYGTFYALAGFALASAPEVPTPKRLLLYYGEASYPGQYYFVLLIQTFAVAAMLPRRVGWERARWVVAGSVGAGLGLVVLAHAEAWQLASTLPRVVYRIVTTPYGIWLWFFYFALGARMGAQLRDGAPPRAPLAAVLGAAGLVVATLGWPAIPDWQSPTIQPYARVSVYAGSALLILALPRIATLHAPAWLAELGRDSFGIFVLNPAVLAATSAAFGAPTSIGDSLLRVCATLPICIGGTRLLRRSARWALP